MDTTQDDVTSTGKKYMSCLIFNQFINRNFGDIAQLVVVAGKKIKLLTIYVDINVLFTEGKITQF